MASFFSAIATSVSSHFLGSAIVNTAKSDGCTRDIIKSRLDPISFLAVIALMKYRLTDTKIHIGDHSVSSSHSSDYTYGWNFRSVSRLYYGDSHEDLAMIRPAIKTIACWHQLHSEDNVEIREFMDHVAEGIKALMATYKVKYPTTCDALEFYMLRIQYYKEHEPEEMEELNEITTQVKKLWTKEEIGQLNAHLRKMTEMQGTTPISTKVLCESEIAVYNARVEAKFKETRRIYS